MPTYVAGYGSLMSEESLQRTLPGKQIQAHLGIGYRRLKRLLNDAYPKNPVPEVSSVQPYKHLVTQWYGEHPRLKATQIFERLKSYGYKGSYASVQRFTKKYYAV